MVSSLNSNWRVVGIICERDIVVLGMLSCEMNMFSIPYIDPGLARIAKNVKHYFLHNYIVYVGNCRWLNVFKTLLISLFGNPRWSGSRTARSIIVR